MEEERVGGRGVERERGREEGGSSGSGRDKESLYIIMQMINR